MSIVGTLARIGATIVASEAIRGFGARLAFAVLHKLAAKTDNQLDDEAVRIAEEVYWGYRRPGNS